MAYKELILPQKLSVEREDDVRTARQVSSPSPTSAATATPWATPCAACCSPASRAPRSRPCASRRRRTSTQALPGVKEDIMTSLEPQENCASRSSPTDRSGVSPSQQGGHGHGQGHLGQREHRGRQQGLVIAHLEAGGSSTGDRDLQGPRLLPAEELRAQEPVAAGFLPVDALFSPSSRCTTTSRTHASVR